MMKNVGTETSTTATTWPVQHIYMMKKLAPAAFPIVCTWLVQLIDLLDEKSLLQRLTPIVCTWSVQPIYMMKKVSPETSPTVSICPVQPTYMMQMLLHRHPLEPLHGM
jgi:hypothetical protein